MAHTTPTLVVEMKYNQIRSLKLLAHSSTPGLDLAQQNMLEGCICEYYNGQHHPYALGLSHLSTYVTVCVLLCDKA